MSRLYLCTNWYVTFTIVNNRRILESLHHLCLRLHYYGINLSCSTTFIFIPIIMVLINIHIIHDFLGNYWRREVTRVQYPAVHTIAWRSEEGGGEGRVLRNQPPRGLWNSMGRRLLRLQKRWPRPLWWGWCTQCGPMHEIRHRATIVAPFRPTQHRPIIRQIHQNPIRPHVHRRYEVRQCHCFHDKERRIIITRINLKYCLGTSSIIIQLLITRIKHIYAWYYLYIWSWCMSN